MIQVLDVTSRAENQNGPQWRFWTKLGIWQALFERLKDRDPSLGMIFPDDTNIRAHYKAEGAAQKGASEAAEAIVKHLAAQVEVLAARSVSP